MYLERLLKDIGIGGEIVRGDYIIGHKFDVNLNGYFIKVYIEENDEGAIEYLFTSLSNILIKNIDKILSLFYEDRLLQNGETQINEPNNLFKAIKEDKLEEWASSLYNNKKRRGDIL